MLYEICTATKYKTLKDYLLQNYRKASSSKLETFRSYNNEINAKCKILISPRAAINGKRKRS